MAHPQTETPDVAEQGSGALTGSREPDPQAVSALRASIPSAISDALLAVVDAVRDYLPPDGIAKDEFIGRVIEVTDNPSINPYIRALENGDQ